MNDQKTEQPSSASAVMPGYTFALFDKYEIAGRGTVYAVANPVGCVDFSHLIGATITIDGRQYVCKGVEHFAHCPPWRAGEKIGLLV